MNLHVHVETIEKCRSIGGYHVFLQLFTGFAFTFLHCSRHWVAVKELKISYHTGSI